jgi:guanylate kinase
MSKKTKFVITYGSSGSGKTTLLKMMLDKYPGITIHKKHTTRKQRPDEIGYGSINLIFISKAAYLAHKKKGAYAVIYNKYDRHYGVVNEQLKLAQTKPGLHFIVISDVQAIKKFKRKYPQSKAIYIYTNPQELERRVRQRGGPNYKKRIEQVHSEYQEYIHNNTVFDYIISNNTTLEDAFLQFDNIVKAIKKNKS